MWTILKIDNFKKIGHSCIIPFVWVAPVYMTTTLDKKVLSYKCRKGTQEITKMFAIWKV